LTFKQEKAINVVSLLFGIISKPEARLEGLDESLLLELGMNRDDFHNGWALPDRIRFTSDGKPRMPWEIKDSLLKSTKDAS
jgi:hypothetical protein